ncbi:MAG: hypothetical protein ACXVZ3_08550 [Gaiellaceae bacterium]
MLRGAGSTYRAHPKTVVGLAVVVFGVAAALDTLVAGVLHDKYTLLVALLTGPLSVSMAGIVLYAGMLDRVVGHHLHGHERPTIRDALRTLPWGRLLAADALLVAGTTIGAALFVVPGLIFFTLFCLVGPLVNIEGIGVVAAFRRSASLVRGALWPTVFLVTVPTYVEITLLHGVEFAEADHSYLLAFGVSAVIGATVGAFVGLFEVTLAYELLLAERQR